VVVWMGKLLPDVHRELHRVSVLGDVVAIELSIRVRPPCSRSWVSCRILRPQSRRPRPTGRRPITARGT
jgi:hypothetical protein